MPVRSWCAAAAAVLVLGTAVPASAATPDALHVRADKILGAWPASAVAIVDPTNGRLLYGKRADTPLPAASLLKMVTSILVAERLRADDVVTISAAAGHARDDQIAWRQGATYTVDQVLHGMLMESSNGAAIALAQRVAGSLPAFARLANARAAKLGATHTKIVDPSGLDARGQHASARDLALIASAFLKIPWLAHVAMTKNYSIPWPDGTTARLGNLDRFVNAYPGAVGVKNGYTSAAGNCVAAAATHGGKTLIVVVLNASHVYDSAARLMDAGFATSTIATWEPDHLPVVEPSSVDSLRTRAAAKTREVATVKHSGGGHSIIPLMIVLILTIYGSRVVQIRRRRIRRRRARRRARIEVTRAHIEARYARPMSTPRALPLREPDEPRRTRASSHR
jgi:D-alanyl-D-alanine carboxypeptidase